MVTTVQILCHSTLGMTDHVDGDYWQTVYHSALGMMNCSDVDYGQTLSIYTWYNGLCC